MKEYIFRNKRKPFFLELREKVFPHVKMMKHIGWEKRRRSSFFLSNDDRVVYKF